MRILALTDLHGKTTVLPQMANMLSGADLVVLCGDITHFGREPEMKAVIRQIQTWNQHIFAVSGNCDYPEAENFLANEAITLTLRTRLFGEFQLTGLNGSLPCPGRTPQEFSEEEYSALLDDLTIQPGKPLILVSHQPPFGTLTDQVSPGYHVGSSSVRHFIEKHQPLVCFTGHIHEGIAIDHIGKTAIVNPGPAGKGNYAIAEIEGVSINNIQLHNLIT